MYKDITNTMEVIHLCFWQHRLHLLIVLVKAHLFLLFSRRCDIKRSILDQMVPPYIEKNRPVCCEYIKIEEKLWNARIRV